MEASLLPVTPSRGGAAGCVGREDRRTGALTVDRGASLMFRLDLGTTQRYCDGISRRSFLQLGVAGLASVGLPQLLRAKDESAAKTGSTKNTSVILIWLDGGPSHLDLYDMKPD